jgi:hypothetical protein
MTVVRVIDFETTGMEPPAEVCEVGICDLRLEDRKNAQREIARRSGG